MSDPKDIVKALLDGFDPEEVEQLAATQLPLPELYWDVNPDDPRQGALGLDEDFVVTFAKVEDGWEWVWFETKDFRPEFEDILNEHGSLFRTPEEALAFFQPHVLRARRTFESFDPEEVEQTADVPYIPPLIFDGPSEDDQDPWSWYGATLWNNNVSVADFSQVSDPPGSPKKWHVSDVYWQGFRSDLMPALHKHGSYFATGQEIVDFFQPFAERVMQENFDPEEVEALATDSGLLLRQAITDTGMSVERIMRPQEKGVIRAEEYYLKLPDAHLRAVLTVWQGSERQHPSQLSVWADTDLPKLVSKDVPLLIDGLNYYVKFIWPKVKNLPWRQQYWQSVGLLSRWITGKPSVQIKESIDPDEVEAVASDSLNPFFGFTPIKNDLGATVCWVKLLTPPEAEGIDSLRIRIDKYAKNENHPHAYKVSLIWGDQRAAWDFSDYQNLARVVKDLEASSGMKREPAGMEWEYVRRAAERERGRLKEDIDPEEIEQVASSAIYDLKWERAGQMFIEFYIPSREGPIAVFMVDHENRLFLFRTDIDAFGANNDDMERAVNKRAGTFPNVEEAKAFLKAYLAPPPKVTEDIDPEEIEQVAGAVHGPLFDFEQIHPDVWEKETEPRLKAQPQGVLGRSFVIRVVRRSKNPNFAEAYSVTTYAKTPGEMDQIWKDTCPWSELRKKITLHQTWLRISYGARMESIDPEEVEAVAAAALSPLGGFRQIRPGVWEKDLGARKLAPDDHIILNVVQQSKNPEYQEAFSVVTYYRHHEDTGLGTEISHETCSVRRLGTVIEYAEANAKLYGLMAESEDFDPEEIAAVASTPVPKDDVIVRSVVGDEYALKVAIRDENTWIHIATFDYEVLDDEFACRWVSRYTIPGLNKEALRKIRAKNGRDLRNRVASLFVFQESEEIDPEEVEAVMNATLTPDATPPPVFRVHPKGKKYGMEADIALGYKLSYHEYKPDAKYPKGYKLVNIAYMSPSYSWDSKADQRRGWRWQWSNDIERFDNRGDWDSFVNATKKALAQWGPIYSLTPEGVVRRPCLDPRNIPSWGYWKELPSAADFMPEDIQEDFDPEEIEQAAQGRLKEYAVIYRDHQSPRGNNFQFRKGYNAEQVLSNWQKEFPDVRVLQILPMWQTNESLGDEEEIENLATVGFNFERTLIDFGFKGSGRAGKTTSSGRENFSERNYFFIHPKVNSMHPAMMLWAMVNRPVWGNRVPHCQVSLSVPAPADAPEFAGLYKHSPLVRTFADNDELRGYLADLFKLIEQKITFEQFNTQWFVESTIYHDAEIPVLTEAMYGATGKVVLTTYLPREGPQTKTFDAVVSKNTKSPPELPYRFTWFGKDLEASHVDCDKEEADQLVKGLMPQRLWQEITTNQRVNDVRFEVVK